MSRRRAPTVPPSPLLVATTNPGKLAELAPLLAELGYAVHGLGEHPRLPVAPEEAPDFAGNAQDKARHYARLTGCAALADDSGLEVTALGGAPGVRSARFAGEDADDAANNALLLERLTGVTDRRARFVCALCLVDADGTPRHELSGTVAGTLLPAPRGTGGFGYDPLFVPDDPAAGGRSFAELTREQKRSISHRGRALAALAEALAAEAPGARPAAPSADAAPRARGRP